MNAPTHALNWFEIPVRDIDRAQRFYEQVLQRTLKREAMGPELTLAVFPYAQGEGAGGCLMAGGALAPAAQGTLVYLDAGPRLDDAVARVAGAGGRVLQPRVDLPDGMGAFVHIQDPEGNRVGLHAMA
ncbi:MAG: VOC family protein [Rubrivivax sp.]